MQPAVNKDSKKRDSKSLINRSYIKSNVSINPDPALSSNPDKSNLHVDQTALCKALLYLYFRYSAYVFTRVWYTCSGVKY